MEYKQCLRKKFLIVSISYFPWLPDFEYRFLDRALYFKIIYTASLLFFQLYYIRNGISVIIILIRS